MAKVSGPLMSMDASGAIGEAIVFGNWKGNKTVRGWVKPANPKTGSQGDTRLILGGTGRACSAVKVGSDYAGQLNTLDLIPSGQSKQSYLVKKIIDLFMPNATQFEAMYTEYNGHSAKSDFDSAASDLALATVNITYKNTSNSYVGGLMVYMLAKIAIALGFTGSPYETALASWTDTEIDAMLVDLAV